MLSKTYAAFVAAGVSDAKAREAAEEIAALDRRLTRLETITATTLAIAVAIAAGVAKLVFA